jgi:signal transduction histidine kinase/CheY-like chemotaxis protein
LGQALWLLLAGAAGLWVCLTGCGKGTAAQGHEYAKRSIGELSRRQVEAGARVELQGTVTYADPVYGLLFVEDDSGAVRVEARHLDAKLQQDRLVRVRGAVAENAGASFVADAEVLDLSQSRAKAPLRAPLEKLIAEGFQDRLVEIQGVVRGVTTERSGRLLLRMTSQGRPLEVRISALVAHEPKRFIYKTLEVRGVLSVVRDYSGKPVHVEMWAQRGDDARVIREASTPAEMPLWTVGRLAAAGKQRLPDERLRMHGNLSTRVRDGSLWFRDATGEIRLRPSAGSVLEGSGEADIAGFAAAEFGLLSIMDAMPLSASDDDDGRPLAGVAELGTVRQVHGLSVHEALKRYPVRLRGVVTYFDPSWGMLFVQDATGGIFMNAFAERGLPFRAGRDIEVAGVTGAGDFAPTVTQFRARLLPSWSDLPKPASSSLDDLFTGRLDGEWVEASGVVRSVEETNGHTILQIVSGVHEMQVTIPSNSGGAAGWIDSKVRIRGVCGAIFNTRRQLTGINLFAPSPEYVEVTEPGPADPFRLPLSAIDSLRQFVPERSPDHRVRIRGTAIMQGSNGLYVQDDTGGVLLAAVGAQRIAPGEIVEAVGFPEPGSLTTVLSETILRLRGYGGSPTATPIIAEQARRDGRYDGQLVRMEGTVVDRISNAEGSSVVLQSGSAHFSAQLAARFGDLSWLQQGSLTRITGVCEIAEAENSQASVYAPHTFRLLLRAPSDVELLREPPWWTGETARRAMLSMGILIVAISAWATILRRRVRLQTATIRKKLDEEAALRIKQETAEAANTAKGQFLANMSHEMRTPMNAVKGFTHLLGGTSLTPEQREYTELVGEAADSLLGVINDILDFSKIEAGKLSLETIPFRLRDCLRGSVALFQHAAESKRIQLRLEIAEEIPEAAAGDALRLRQILTNLIGNAVKFTSQGSIVVAARLAEQTPESIGMAVDVTDSGIGIAPEQREAIFSAFVQADSSIARKHGGTGLGLAISSRLVELMGGAIRIASEVGRGSTFSFTVELKTAGADSLAPKPKPLAVAPSAPLSVLVAEDNRVNQRLITRLLERGGHRITMTSNGREVVARYSEERFDLILMDVQMPEVDGLQATAQIRALEAATGGHTPIIALTAHAMIGDREKFLAAGLDAYLPKPIDPSALQAAVAAATNGAVRDAASRAEIQDP